MTEQPEHQADEPKPDAPSWVPADPAKADPEAGGEPAPVGPPVDPNTAVTPPEPSEPATEVSPEVEPEVQPAAIEQDQPEVAAAAHTPEPVVPEPTTPEPIAPEPIAPPTPPVPPPPVTHGPAGDASGASAAASDRPEIPIGAAFAGGFVLALILKRFAR